MQPLVSAAWLREHLGERDLRIIDARWYLTEPGRGLAEYRAGHISGAVYLSIDGDLSATHHRGPGRHPLPSADAFAATMGRAGIGAATRVVAYDTAGGSIAARLWWLLRHFGHTEVALLDGGYAAWLAAGGAPEAGDVAVEPATFVAQPAAGDTLDADGVEAARHDGATLLLDARAPERFSGSVEPMDPRAGHIPGAVSAHFGGNLKPDGRFKPPAELRERFDALGALDAAQVVCSCGSGVTACHNLFALHLLGREDARLYPGSWSDWSAQPERPIATGDE